MNKLIKLSEGYIVTSDEGIKEGDVAYTSLNKAIHCITKDNVVGCNIYKENWAKIIASTFHPELPQIEQIEFDLSDEDAKKIDYVDIEKLAKKSMNQILGYEDLPQRWMNEKEYEKCIGFLKGFRTAQSLSDKMFSLEDMKQAIKIGIKISKQDSVIYQKELNDNYIQSLSRSKQWDIIGDSENGKLKITKLL